MDRIDISFTYREWRRHFIIALFIVFLCFSPYIGNFDFFRDKEGFADFKDLSFTIWFMFMSLLAMSGWVFAFINGGKKTYRLVFLAPITMLALQFFVQLLGITSNHFNTFSNKLFLNILILFTFTTLPLFKHKGDGIQTYRFSTWLLITVSSVLPYLHDLSYFQGKEYFRCFPSLSVAVMVISMFLMTILGWIFAFISSTDKLYRFVMLAPIGMLAFQLIGDFLMKIGSNQMILFHNLDIGSILGFLLLTFLVVNYFRCKRNKK